MTVLTDTKRDWDYIREADKVAWLMREKLARAHYYLKHTDPPAEFYIGESEGSKFTFHCAPDLAFPEDRVTLFTTVKRHIEIDMRVLQLVEPGSVQLQPMEARIGKSDRQYPRIGGVSRQIQAANFQVSKNEVAIDPTKPQVTNKVIFADFEKRLQTEFPGIKIYEYASRERPPETVYLNKREGAIFVRDASDLGEYRGAGEGELNYFDILEEEEDGYAEKIRRKYMERNLQAVLAAPVQYEMADGRHSPIAFFYCETRRGTQTLPNNAVERLAEIAGQIRDRIEDANLISIKDKQSVVNISEGGVALELTNPDLVKYVPHRRRLTFDLIFKMQAPLRFVGSVCHMQNTGPETLLVGLNLVGSGHSDFRKTNRERLVSLVRMMKG